MNRLSCPSPVSFLTRASFGNGAVTVRPNVTTEHFCPRENVVRKSKMRCSGETINKHDL